MKAKREREKLPNLSSSCPLSVVGGRWLDVMKRKAHSLARLLELQRRVKGAVLENFFSEWNKRYQKVFVLELQGRDYSPICISYPLSLLREGIESPVYYGEYLREPALIGTVR